jgi:hypothetical protein
MKLWEYISEIKLRMHRLNVLNNLSDIQLATYMNMARKQAQRLAVDLVPHRFARIVRLNISSVSEQYSNTANNFYGQQRVLLHRVILPRDFIDAYSVRLSFVLNGQDRLYEARKYSMEEMFTINAHTWNKPLPTSPVYALSVEDIVGNTRNDKNWVMYLGGLTIDTNLTLFDTVDDGTVPEVEVWYTAILPDLELDAEDIYNAGDAEDDLTMPPDIEEFAINMATFYALQYIGAQQQAQIVNAEINRLRQLITENYFTAEQKASSLLPSQEGLE